MHDQDPTSMTRFLAVYNSSALPVPPFGVMRSISYDRETGIYTVGQPNADSQTEVFVNGATTIPGLSYGQGHRTDPATVLIETAGGTPASSDDYGTTSGSWKLHKGKTGFRCMGAVGDNTIEATFYGSSFKRLLAAVSGIAVEDTSGASIATGVDTLQFGYSTLATLHPFNAIAVADMGGGTVAVTARFATRDNAGVLAHDEYTPGYQELGGVKAFVHPLVIGPQNALAGDTLAGGTISFVPLDDPTIYDGDAPSGSTPASTLCVYGCNLGDSSQIINTLAQTNGYSSATDDASATLSVWSGKPAITPTLRPAITLECEIVGTGSASSYQDNRGFHVGEALTVGGGVTVSGGNIVGPIDSGSDRQVTLGVASY